MGLVNSRFFQHACFLIRFRYRKRFLSSLRKTKYRLLGMKVGAGTKLPLMFVTWPHQLSIGANCQLEHAIYFKFDGIWKNGQAIIVGDNVFIGAGCEFNIRKGITIGNDSLIASGCKFIDHDHGIKQGIRMRLQSGEERDIKIGNDVWLGFNVIVLKGVEIGEGAVVAAGAIVTKSILPGEIWAGVPARKIGERGVS